MANKFQPFKYHSVEEVLENLPPDQLEITLALRNLVLDSILDIQEKLSFNILSYHRKRHICYIWPGAIPWGKLTKDSVEFGFAHGNLLSDELHYLEKGTRKQVYFKTFRKLDEIEPEIIKAYLWEAIEVDELKRLPK